MSEFGRRFWESTAAILVSTAVGSFAAGFATGQHIGQQVHEGELMSAFNAGRMQGMISTGAIYPTTTPTPTAPAPAED